MLYELLFTLHSLPFFSRRGESQPLPLLDLPHLGRAIRLLFTLHASPFTLSG